MQSKLTRRAVLAGVPAVAAVAALPAIPTVGLFFDRAVVGLRDS